MTEKKKIMIFDDNLDYQNLVDSLIARYDYYAELIPSITKLDATNWNNFWDCIVSDVDFEGQDAPGHSIISDRIKQHHLNCPVIVMTGVREYNLPKMREEYGDTFAAYLSKTDQDFEIKLIRAIEEALYNSTKLALARFKTLFKELNKLDYVIARDELSDEMLGITPREGDTTIGMLIDDCTKMLTEETDIDQIEIDSYKQILWKMYEDIIRARY
jgi:DNA-binding NtrC family response regulator